MRLTVRGGAFASLKQLVRMGSKPLLVTDRSSLDRHVNLFCQMYPDARVQELAHEPRIADVLRIQDRMHADGADSIVALGGGSVLDAAKAANAWCRNARGLAATPGRLLVAIPTTAGTGAEVTPFAAIAFGAEKRLLAGAALAPSVSVVDYTLTLSMPPLLTACTGMGALCHALEAYVSRRRTDESDAYALSALRRIGKSLVACVHEPGDEVRAEMMHASTEAALAFSKSSATLVHGMSRPLGRFGVPHGMANAQLVSAVTRFSEGRDVARYEAVRGALFPDVDAGASLPPPLSALLARLVAGLGIVPLREVLGDNLADVRRSIPQMAREALRSGSPAHNPRIPTQSQIRRIYAQLLGVPLEKTNDP